MFLPIEWACFSYFLSSKFCIGVEEMYLFFYMDYKTHTLLKMFSYI